MVTGNNIQYYTQWAHLCCSFYGHLRVPTIINHYKQNLDIPKLIFPEVHYPQHMRSGIILRIARFIFFLFTLLASVLFLNIGFEKEIYDICERREECYKSCVEDTFPDIQCSTLDPSITLSYYGNQYKDFYLYPSKDTNNFQTCLDYSKQNADHKYAESDSDRMWRVHTCFPHCIHGSLGHEGFAEDTRPSCQESIGDTPTDNSLICLGSSFPCEIVKKKREHCIDTESETCVDFAIIPLIILIANALQVIFEVSLLLVFETSLKPTTLEMLRDPESTRQLSSPNFEYSPNFEKIAFKCTGEMAVCTVFGTTIFFGIAALLYAIKYGRLSTVFFEFFIAFLFDQFKALFLQPILWWTIVRRCGKLEIGIAFDDWNDEYLAACDTEDSLCQQIRIKLKKFIENKIVTNFMLAAVFFLCFVIFTEVALSRYIENSQQMDDIFYYLNYIVLSIFMADIILRIIVYGYKFFSSPLTVLDAVVVAFSFLIIIFRFGIAGSNSVRLLRLVKVVTELKKVSNTKKKIIAMIREQRRQGTQNLVSNVEKIIDYLEKIKDLNNLPQLMKEDIDWICAIIQEGKLFSEDFSDFKLEEGKEVKCWLEMIRKAPPRGIRHKTTTQKETENNREGEKGGLTRGQGLRAVSFRAQATHDFKNEIMRILDITLGEQQIFDEALLKLDDWSFDSSTATQMLGAYSFTYLGLRVITKYMQVKEMNFSISILINYLKELENDYIRSNPFHSKNKIVDNIQALHYFLFVGKLRRFFKNNEIVALFLASFIHDYSHPGLTNEFLIRSKHPIAMRYNDQSVLENHHLAMAFELMNSESRFNVLGKFSERGLFTIRKFIIGSVLSSAMSNHFALVTAFKAKLGSNFPKNNETDKRLLSGVCLRASDLGLLARGQNQGVRWAELMFEELQKQGELEKSIGLRVGQLTDKYHTATDKAALAFIEVVCLPLFGSFVIFSDNLLNKELLNGINHTKKQFETRVDSK